LTIAVELASDHVVRWRSLGALFVIGGLLSLSAIPLTTTAGVRALVVALLGTVAVLTGLSLWACAGSLPTRFMSSALGLGTLLITLAIVASGQPDGRYSLLYVWVTLEACYFLTPPRAARHLLLVAAGYGIALVILGGSGDQWVLVLGTAATGGWLVGALRARIDRLSAEARRDVLTGLSNRRGFDEDIGRELELARHRQQRLSLIAIDFDGFKDINDQRGHQAGDAALRQLSAVLQDTVDLPLARLGGDEFAVIARDHDQAAASALAGRVNRAVRLDRELARLDATVSVGIAIFPAHGDCTETLAHAADRALYRAKENGGDTIVIYGPQIAGEHARPGSDAGGSSGHLKAVILLSEALDLRDVWTSAHSQTVARYAHLIARELDLDPYHAERIRLAGIVHDLGKVGVPDQVLLKPGPLTPDEWLQMQRHPEIGAQILASAGLRDLSEWVLAHHERPDATGYPFGLSAEEIPVEARILSVADAYEAMTSDRPYRAAMSRQAAAAELLRNRDSQFDAAVVTAFLRVLDPHALDDRMSLRAA
jgi:diguanylate cyclase (GGDEF)-like protein